MIKRKVKRSFSFLDFVKEGKPVDKEWNQREKEGYRKGRNSERNRIGNQGRKSRDKGDYKEEEEEEEEEEEKKNSVGRLE